MVELEDFKPSLTPAVMAEFIGSFLLQFLAGAAAANAADNGLSAAALGVGLAVAMLTYSTCHISGGHLNPAITLGCVCVGVQGIGIKEAISYTIAQFVGAICGAFLVKSCLPVEALIHPFVTLGSLSDMHSEQVFIFEFMCTLVLGLVFFAAIVDEKRSMAGNAGPLAVGLAYTIGMFAEGPFTGGSMNPARTLGPALAFGNFGHVWVYMLATFLGGLAAAFFYKLALGVEEEEEEPKKDVHLAQKFV
mmetsp:Transcript_36708/g.75257  ORF Transcript_36708/g.75257 Transcript_36708/m.75257 type:complete len:248 (+) Transcript_36708:151-894(+)|eukprot:CAMPEP_0181326538 /NCGR_PEP_ID=MMETSP1101-20121128/21561_1 /TAXON_ID=46948 /ORGANISM="Rhodomonas abbreviata, Strain Caron Lab Isolate" /LENGTH=247 /DNA_ID=CAMNT_0023435017 /DNA_START=138 /DNA_END=881 /DNA_ORIENTATION=+